MQTDPAHASRGGASPGPGPDALASNGLAAVSVDVEDYFQVEALRHLCPRDRWETFEDRTVPNTLRLLNLLAQQGARGTFYVLGWTARRHPDLVKRIAASGHEIASHGMDHELVYNQTPDAFRRDVRTARKLLQDLSGQEVLGYRAPSYTIMARTLWALPVLLEEGYRYDSSVFPIPRRRYGMPGARRWPHRLDLGPSGSITEFPLPTVRLGWINIPATGGAYLRLFPEAFQRWAVTRMLRRAQPFVVSIHPWELDPEQPKFPVPPKTRWTHYHNLSAAAGRLHRLLSLARFVPQAEVLRRLRLV